MEKCDHEMQKRSEKYDAYYCPDCDVWLENKCKDPDCEFCSRRPEKPSQVSEENES